MTAKHETVTVYKSPMLALRDRKDPNEVPWRNPWHWRMKATNGAIVADGSEGYHRRRWCLRGVEIVLGAKPGSLQFLKAGESKLVKRRNGDVLVKVEAS